MKHDISTIIAPLFEIASKIICDTTIQLHVDIASMTVPGLSQHRRINWYVGDPRTPAYGDYNDNLLLNEDDFDEDKLCVWVEQLWELYNDYFREDEEELDEWSWQEDTVMNEREV